MLSLDLNRYPYLQKISRICGIIVLAAFLLLRLLMWRNYGPDWLRESIPLAYFSIKLLWITETLFFSLLLFSYICRSSARVYAAGFMETVFPYICAILPFLLSRSSFLMSLTGGDIPQQFTRLDWLGLQMNVCQVHINPLPLMVINMIMLAGALVSFASMTCLIRSFSIKVEARALVTGGLYSYVRHPIYLGEFISALGLLLLRFTWINLAIYVIFILAQSHRASLEEKKLESVYPEYGEYRRKTGRFFPRLARL